MNYIIRGSKLNKKQAYDVMTNIELMPSTFGYDAKSIINSIFIDEYGNVGNNGRIYENGDELIKYYDKLAEKFKFLSFIVLFYDLDELKKIGNVLYCNKHKFPLKLPFYVESINEIIKCFSFAIYVNDGEAIFVDKNDAENLYYKFMKDIEIEIVFNRLDYYHFIYPYVTENIAHSLYINEIINKSDKCKIIRSNNKFYKNKDKIVSDFELRYNLFFEHHISGKYRFYKNSECIINNLLKAGFNDKIRGHYLTNIHKIMQDKKYDVDKEYKILLDAKRLVTTFMSKLKNINDKSIKDGGIGYNEYCKKISERIMEYNGICQAIQTDFRYE